jgi:hypothetical protein
MLDEKKDQDLGKKGQKVSYTKIMIVVARIWGNKQFAWIRGYCSVVPNLSCTKFPKLRKDIMCKNISILPS